MTRAELLQQLEDAITSMRTAADAITSDPTEAKWKVDIAVELSAIRAGLKSNLDEMTKAAEKERDLFGDGRFKGPLGRLLHILDEAVNRIDQVSDSVDAELTTKEKESADKRKLPKT